MPVSTLGGINTQISSVQIPLSQVIGALSYALDLTEGQPQGHAARSCLLGMRIARELNFSADESSALFYALLLKDLGCSSNASKLCYLFGADDRAVKAEFPTVDNTTMLRMAGYLTRSVAPGGSLLKRATHLARVVVAGKKGAKELIQLRCDRGAMIAWQLQMPDATAEAISALDEHWDGEGYPRGLKGQDIPLLARIMGLSQTFEAFASDFGVEAACEMAKTRSGVWFDPDLVKIVQSFKGEEAFWETFFSADPRQAVLAVEPADRSLSADSIMLDRIAHGFAQVIDAKSPWTFQHSEGVAEISAGLATTLGFSANETRIVRRAALLHDIGKLGISNLILDKPGKLTPEEMTEMRKHPAYTYQLLQQVAGFRELASLAASHHERLDGKGYHRGLSADQMSVADRILCVADIYEALTAKRPYRKDLSPEDSMEILSKNAGAGICPEVFTALKYYLAHGGYTPAAIAA
jgi:putative nucleotidyltransferase with HDIG domain